MESSYHGPPGTICIAYISDDLRGGRIPRVILSFFDYGSNLLCVRVAGLKDTIFRGTVLPSRSPVLPQTGFEGNLEVHCERYARNTSLVIGHRVPFNHSEL